MIVNIITSICVLCTNSFDWACAIILISPVKTRNKYVIIGPVTCKGGKINVLVQAFIEG